MTTYFTNNPIGSTDVKDLFDNAENLDHRENDRENETWPDRLGVERLTWLGIERAADRQRADLGEEFQQFLSSSGYQDLGEYAPGIEITAHNQYVTFGGQPYVLKPSVPVPYTTAGAWTGDDFKLIGDDSLRQDLASADPGKGAAMVAYRQPALGARSRTVSDRLFDLGLSPTEMASFDETPGADNTQAVIDAANAVIDAQGRGAVFIPYGVKFDKLAVQTPGTVPPGVVFWDYSIINGTYPGNGVPGIFDAGDPTSVTDFKYIIGSGHNASFYLSNSGMSGSATGLTKGAAVRWAGGEQSKGSNPGLIMPIAALEFGGDNTAGTWSMTLRHRAPWEAANTSNPGNGYWRWASGVPVVIGEYCFSPSVRRYYKSTTAGTTGSTAPTHLSGSASDGGVTWEMLPATYDQSLFSVDERGRTSWNSGIRPSEFMRVRQQPDDAHPFLINYEATSPNKNIVLQFSPTDGSGDAPPALPRLSAEPSRLRFGYSQTTKSVSQSEEAFTFHGAIAKDLVTLTNSGATPSVSLRNTLVINNSVSTSITALADIIVGQQVTLIFTNSNTTVVNGAGFRLSGGADYVPGSAGGSLTVMRVSHTNALVELSRAVY